MASVDECEQALHALAERMAASGSGRQASFDRTLSCTLPDLGVIFGGRIHAGELTGIKRVETGDAQVRLTMSSDDLLDMVGGTLPVASAWATGRIKIGASVLDLVRLKSIF